MKHFFVLLLCLLLLLSGCSGEKSASSTRYLTSMDTVMVLTAYGPSRDRGLDLAQAEIEALNDSLSTGLPDSEISLLNRDGSAVLSREPLELLNSALELYRSTGGLFDPTVYPLVKLWGFYDKDYHVPSDRELADALPLLGADRIRTEGSTVTLGQGQQIDLGGIGKGYASQRACEILKQAGVQSALLSLGGNVQCLGSKPDGSPWNIGIRDPWSDSGALYAAVKVENQAVITSGGYERYFEDPETHEIYRHILDPRTGCPAESGLSSVSIVTSDGTVGDGLSTALYIMGLEQAAEYWRTHGDFEAILIADDGTLYATEGLRGQITSQYAIVFLTR